MRRFVGLAVMASIVFSGSNAAAALVGSIDTALYGYTPTAFQGEAPLGVTVGFTACPGGPGTNIACNTAGGTFPAYMFENIGLIAASAAQQSFTQDASSSPSFASVVTAMSAGLFNFSFAHRTETGGSLGIPLSGYSYGGAGPSDNLSGYWLGSAIDFVTLTVDAFAFRTVDFGQSGAQTNEIYNPQGAGLYGTDRLVRMRFDFYGTQGTYQEGAAAPGLVPEPPTWLMLILGFASVGGELRRRRPRSALR